MKEVAACGREKAEKAAQQLDALTSEQLDATVQGPHGPMTARAMAMLEFGHLVHHRGQLYMVLRALGVVPPGFM